MTTKEAFESWLSPKTIEVIQNFRDMKDGDGLKITNKAHLDLAFSWVNTSIVDDEMPDSSLYILQNITPVYAEHVQTLINSQEA